MSRSHTWTLVGGGLFNCLLALRLNQLGRTFRIFEQSAHLAGDHTWSFHHADIDEADWELLRPCLTREWKGYDVRFPSYSRNLQGGYFTIRSEDLRKVMIREVPGRSLHISQKWESKPSSHEEILIRAEGVGEVPASSGWQKFVGWDVHFSDGHGLTEPVLMDVTVEQKDGFRFLYILPFDAERALVEDTRYSNTAEIDERGFEHDLSAYIHSKWPDRKWNVERVEKAALPIPTEFTGQRGRFGMAGGFFHPTTGYSLPYALRTSRRLIECIEGGLSTVGAWDKIDSEIRSNQHFYLMLNRMMFFASRPPDRWRIFSRFYRLSPKLIERFYAGRSTAFDKIRILAGRPPVPVFAAARVLLRSERAPVWT